MESVANSIRFFFLALRWCKPRAAHIIDALTLEPPRSFTCANVETALWIIIPFRSITSANVAVFCCCWLRQRLNILCEVASSDWLPYLPSTVRRRIVMTSFIVIDFKPEKMALLSEAKRRTSSSFIRLCFAPVGERERPNRFALAMLGLINLHFSQFPNLMRP